ncbi:uncharacterized protein K460DRAFT_408067 [Cucurbitaria berberidis CBS 394.84]|uniref:Uncharacterized protein n=1 Tax=Cucurbitaria berberidis CBS 394.84 TaxID=1168544 RepID=A0A9P4GEF6_9PLEO|nr:uncharacterized protein K460DRAFT_408067 [Cucurbitaria berberidis CBS 394.84]KAF1843744.1 hypothetical protein K460DRAFT_408067 [Cucurbitaria berberidis CBS 394.84]
MMSRSEDTFQYINSAPSLDSDEQFSTIPQLRRGFFKIIVERLKERNITSPLLTEASLAWCLPTSTDQESIWRLLLEDSLSVPTYMIDALLNLEPSTPNSKVTGPNVIPFYIRSFNIQTADLREILRELLDDGYDLMGRVFLWLQRMDNEDDNAYVILRYCGQTKNRPWDRHVSDTYSTSLSGLFDHFLKKLGQRCCAVLTEALVQVVVDASTELHLPVAQLNLREQVLIAIFGDGVLNLQSGGKDFMGFNDEDQVAFVSIQSDTIRLLQQHARPCSQAMKDGISQYASEVRKYVEANPSTRGDEKRPFTEKVENMIQRQVTPSVLASASAIMVTLGSDIGEKHEDEEDTFFEAGGRAAEAATACYNYFSTWERGLGLPLDVNSTKQLVQHNNLPFVDMFPWFTKNEKDYSAARKLFVNYHPLPAKVVFFILNCRHCNSSKMVHIRT